ncbi:hypothetical protein CDL12_02290 [Handroanthus impetiginosus]|uniref:Uncharacterized protein n=1 Tax=Handroanthus impetiginosus TaxID=429701 RepID=A0A2G9I5E1_9LAMI|nr:hypothetical protein CDL12_02290 [Handroanthus impetiginosus]
MAETPSKRLREESYQESDGSGANSKRQKPYSNILNLLDEEEEAEQSQEPSHELSQDLSAIFTTLQQELSSSPTTAAFDLDSLPSAAAVEETEQSQHGDPSAECGGGDDDGVKSVMRHLLEASDDELGIPNTKDDENNFGILNSGENFPLDNGLWELEDEAANYYTVLQAELFM